MENYIYYLCLSLHAKCHTSSSRKPEKTEYRTRTCIIRIYMYITRGYVSSHKTEIYISRGHPYTKKCTNWRLQFTKVKGFTRRGGLHFSVSKEREQTFSSFDGINLMVIYWLALLYCVDSEWLNEMSQFLGWSIQRILTEGTPDGLGQCLSLKLAVYYFWQLRFYDKNSIDLYLLC